ncbi:MAG: hypothetical protein RI947_374 [Candidatus Parcubacteria bacterium]|jgi:small subunit ribosomal protein S20
MPNIKSAKKKMRQDVKRETANTTYRKSVKQSVKNLSKIKTGKSKEELSKAYSVIDKAVKRKVLHKNKAARLKSRISKS